MVTAVASKSAVVYTRVTAIREMEERKNSKSRLFGTARSGNLK